ncbi:MAG: hemerythrin domain-containing protein [Acidimicrobiales bacterium]
MDAITLLREDHKAVKRLFARFEKAHRAGNHKEMGAAVQEMISELSRHASIEETVFYPAVRAAVPDASDELDESLEEHHIVKWTLSELDGMSPGQDRFVAKVTVLIESVQHHVEEEEGELFPMVRGAMGRKELADVGARLEQARRRAPRHPNPRAADEPPRRLATVGGRGR